MKITKNTSDAVNAMTRMVVTQGPLEGKSFELSKPNTFLGRSESNDIPLHDNDVSGRHIKVFQIGRKYFVEDLKSSNGTWLNDRRLEPGEGIEICRNDIIRLGKTVLRMEALPEPATAKIAISIGGKELQGPWVRIQADPDRRRPSARGAQLIHDVSGLLRHSFKLHIFCRKVLEYVLKCLPRIDTAAIVYLDPLGEGKFKNKAVILHSNPEIKDCKQNHVSRRIISRVLERRKAVRVLNTEYEYSQNAFTDSCRLRIRSVLCLPLISNSVLRGALYIHSTVNPCGFRREDVMTLDILSSIVAADFERAFLYGLLQHT